MFITSFILALGTALIAGYGFIKHKNKNAFILSFWGCWGFTFFLMPLAGMLTEPVDFPRFSSSLAHQMELATVAWGISAAAFVLVPLIFAIADAVKPERPGRKVVQIVGLIGFLVSFVLMAGSAPDMIKGSPTKRIEAEVKSDLHAIQIAVERYADGNQGHYPIDINDLITNSYLYSFPTNPFSQEPIKSIQIGDPDFEGNFTYEPSVVSGEAIGYQLIAYGSRDTEGADVNLDGKPDHAILVLQGPTVSEHY